MDLANPEWKGKLALAPTETDFQPIVTSIALTYGQQAALAVAQGGGVQRVQPHRPRQRNAHLRRQQRAGRHRPHQPLLLVPAGETAGRDQPHALPDRLLRTPGSRGMSSTCPAPASWRPATTRRRPTSSCRSWSRPRASRPWSTATATNTRCARQCAAPAGLRPFDQLQPAPVTIADLGDGSEALRLIQQAQLL